MKDLFLCHNGLDKQWAKDLGADLEAVEHEGRNLSVWLDEWDIDLGENIVLKIDEGLSGSRHVAVLLSPEMLASDWCQMELTSVVAADPVNREGRLIVLLVRDEAKEDGRKIEIPTFLKPLNYLDFRKKRDYKKQLERLILRLKGERPARRGAKRRGSRRAKATTAESDPAPGKRREDADDVEELLVGNALPVTLPKTIWAAPAVISRKQELPAGRTFPAFILKGAGGGNGKELFTFENLSAGGVHELYPRSVVDFHHGRSLPTRDWLGDSDKKRWLVQLLNETLRSHLRTRGVRFDRKCDRYFFLPSSDGSTRRIKWASGKDVRVAGEPDPEKGGPWIHQAAYLRFVTVGEDILLSILPAYHFTTDGRRAVAREVARSLAPQWGQRERNNGILDRLLFWADFLAEFSPTAAIGSQQNPILLQRLPVTGRASHGLIGDKIEKRALLKIIEEHSTVPKQHATPVQPSSGALSA